MIRVDPGDPFDGLGWGKISMNDKVEAEYMMWGRKEVFIQSAADYDNRFRSPAGADRRQGMAVLRGGWQ